MGNFDENLNLGNRFRPPPPVYRDSIHNAAGGLEALSESPRCNDMVAD